MALDRALAGVRWPSESLQEEWAEYRDLGSTEPWCAQLVSSLLVASGHDTVVETGGYVGITTAWLALTLERMGGGSLMVAEIEEPRATEILKRLASLDIPNVAYEVMVDDVLRCIPHLKDKSTGLAWIDDHHEKHHVETEINLLWPKMRPGGIMAFHDVWGSTDLQSVVRKYGGIALDFPRLGPAGGVGIIQVR